VAAVTCIGIIISQGLSCHALVTRPGADPTLPFPVGEVFLPYLEKTIKALDELEEYPHHNVRRIVVNCYDGQPNFLLISLRSLCRCGSPLRRDLANAGARVSQPEAAETGGDGRAAQELAAGRR
jgi:hypothetical protein